MTDMINASTAAIERRLDLAADPQRVWRALTDSTELAGWFSQRASFPTEVGEEGWLEWDGFGRYRVRIEQLEPGRRIAWRWASNADAPIEGESTLVEWTVESRPGGGSTLLLRESGFVRPAARGDNVAGWLSELDDLVAYLAAEPWQRGIRRTYVLRSAPARSGRRSPAGGAGRLVGRRRAPRDSARLRGLVGLAVGGWQVRDAHRSRRTHRLPELDVGHVAGRPGRRRGGCPEDGVALRGPGGRWGRTSISSRPASLSRRATR